MESGELDEVFEGLNGLHVDGVSDHKIHHKQIHVAELDDLGDVTTAPWLHAGESGVASDSDQEEVTGGLEIGDIPRGAVECKESSSSRRSVMDVVVDAVDRLDDDGTFGGDGTFGADGSYGDPSHVDKTRGLGEEVMDMTPSLPVDKIDAIDPSIIESIGEDIEAMVDAQELVRNPEAKIRMHRTPTRNGRPGLVRPGLESVEDSISGVSHEMEVDGVRGDASEGAAAAAAAGERKSSDSGPAADLKFGDEPDRVMSAADIASQGSTGKSSTIISIPRDVALVAIARRELATDNRDVFCVGEG